VGDIRKDPILNKWVVLNDRRKLRPHDIQSAPVPAALPDANCPFCKGHEEKTPAEIGRMMDDNGEWTMRWFENSFGALDLSKERNLVEDEGLYVHGGAFGHTEVIVETPEHGKQLWDLSLQDITNLLTIYMNRIDKLEQLEGIDYVQVFKNHGKQAGTSLTHSHSQVMALPQIPPSVQEILDVMEENTHCPFCLLLSQESEGPRVCFENSECIALAPYASQFEYEVTIYPKQHISKLSEMDNLVLLADCIKNVLAKLKSLNADFNMYMVYAPLGRDAHLQVHFCPRRSLWAGFELATGMIVNSVYPEDAAQWYRGN